MPVTIYDIAKYTDFSPATVSKVLNHYKGVNKETVKKVEEAVKILGYIPNSSARTLMTRKSFMVGVLLKESNYLGLFHPHFSEILEEFRKQMEINGYDVLFVTNKIGDSDITYLEHCKRRSLDGLMIAASNSDSNGEKRAQIQELIESDIPIISAEELYPYTCTVLSDNVQGARKGLEYLYFLGHRDIGILTVKEDTVAAKERFLGYKNFCTQYKMPLESKNIIRVKGFDYQSGAEGARMLLQLPFQHWPTAFFCIYDEIAVGFIETLKQAQIQVPEDVSVIGFDDLPVAGYFHLTTIRQNRRLIGSIAARKLHDFIRGVDKDQEKIILDTELIIRASCKKLEREINEKC